VRHALIVAGGGRLAELRTAVRGRTLTVLDVALSGDPDAQGAAIEAWGRSVWATWSHVHAAVRQLTDRQLAGWVPHSP